MKRLKLVLSLYACEPNRGSEPGVGWAWALGMAKRHETYVLTRANNQRVIEVELARLKLPESEIPTFIYVDLSPFMCRLKTRGIIPLRVYYLLWQFRARRVLDAFHLNADIVHHVTFCSFMIPGVWWKRKEKVVLGPLGGMSVCPFNFLRLYSPLKRIKEFLRGFTRKYIWRINPFYLLSRRHADALFFTETQIRLKLGKGSDHAYTLLDVAIPVVLESKKYDTSLSRKNQFVWAGVLEPHKGLEIALRAFAHAFDAPSERPTFKVMGAGSGMSAAKRLAVSLGIDSSVEFLGRVSQERLWKEMRQSKGFVFTSLRDTCGSVNLEAMACQCPIICFNHQGVREATDESCAFRVESNSWTAAIAEFSAGMRHLVNDSELGNRMGVAGRKRAIDLFSWDQKFKRADEVYGSLHEGRLEERE